MNMWCQGSFIEKGKSKRRKIDKKLGVGGLSLYSQKSNCRVRVIGEWTREGERER